MKTLITKTLLAVIPTLLLTFITSEAKADIYGYWYDHYSNIKIEIKHTRGGIKVKEHGGWFRKWNRYVITRRGVYDDCDGRVIVVLDYNQIQWYKGRYRKPVILSRHGRHDRYDRRHRYDRDYGYNDSYGRGRSGRYRDDYRRRYNSDRYYGDWYCSERKLRLSIQSYSNGFRAYHDDKYSYYEPFEDHYRDNRGNRYYFDDDYLIWKSRKGDKLRFKRR